MTKTEAIDFAKRSLVSLEAERPTFRVFKRAHDGFIQALAPVHLDALGGSHHIAMQQLSAEFANAPGDAPLWGRIFISLWFCENFCAHAWEELLLLDSHNIQCAVEHCFDVWARSGADGSADLSEFLGRLELWDLVEPKLTEIGGLSRWSENWVAELRSRRR